MKKARKVKGLQFAGNIKNIKRTQYLIENKQNPPKTEPKNHPFWTHSVPKNTQFGPNRTHPEPTAPPSPSQVKLEGVTVNFPFAIDFFHRQCVSSQGARV
jgi:hypothetical protein